MLWLRIMKMLRDLLLKFNLPIINLMPNLIQFILILKNLSSQTFINLISKLEFLFQFLFIEGALHA